MYGWSLGSAVAVRLASEVEQAAVILEGAPASIADIGQQQYPFFPIRLVMRSRFDSFERVDRIRAPILFLHSPEDEVIPIGEGRRLYDAARGEALRGHTGGPCLRELCGRTAVHRHDLGVSATARTRRRRPCAALKTVSRAGCTAPPGSAPP